MADNLFGMYYGGPDDAANNVYNLIGNALDKLKTGAIPRFTDAADRDSKIGAPVRGQVCWLGSPGIGQVYTGTTWSQVFPQQVEADRRTFTLAGGGGIYDGLNNYDLATYTFNRTTPYVVLAIASSRTTGLVGAAALRIIQSGNPAPSQWSTTGITADNVGVNCQAIIPMPSGGSLTVKANLDLAVGSRVQVYIDQTHSHLQVLAMPLGIAL